MVRVSKDPAIRKQELIDIAQKLFIAKGYEATSVREILNEVGGAPGMFYHHFSSKEEIYKIAISQYIDKYVSRINVTLRDKSISISLRVSKLFALITETFGEYLVASKGYKASESQFSDVMVSMKVLSLIANSVEELLIEAREKGLVNNLLLKQNERQLALFLLYGIYGVLHDGSESGLSIELIEKNITKAIPLISNITGISLEILTNGVDK
ncbi:TetR/AcrR family transcriptional regulator [Alkaliphilus peptidifermentans]|uniref:Transcriptional regulator, TetR family n=1 Tax=Alkaliphilus peptidifermentans DSM 18978 TaxID=1120976 RepID=A0A1G5ISU5_9FIRM|nr:TetR/AcrR family transcriptional regulator [Alkaliphilus peptidifermentans]SCY79162.1 transcriptional regulator, TetR family [Alkaliphilus peptidifermentans DSM 18978]